MKALDVAKYIINKCTTDEHPISNLQLQKILYYIQHDFLVNKNKELFEDEFAAWKFGPIVPSIYHVYSTAGGMKLEETYEDIDLNSFEPEDLETINSIVEEKREKNPWLLVDETHKEGKAWDLIFQNGLGFKDPIPKNLIKECGF